MEVNRPERPQLPPEREKVEKPIPELYTDEDFQNELVPPGPLGPNGKPVKSVQVKGHYRNGRWVQGHTRAAPSRGAGRR